MIYNKTHEIYLNNVRLKIFLSQSFPRITLADDILRWVAFKFETSKTYFIQYKIPFM